MVKNLKITVLVDNVANESLLCEWGLSILIEVDSTKILLDTGASDMFSINAKYLNIDISNIDIGVLSHAHFDHANGLDTFFLLNKKAQFLIRKECEENCFGIENGKLEYCGIRHGILNKYCDRLYRISDSIYEISNSIWLVNHRRLDYSQIALRNELYIKKNGNYILDDFSHEQSLVIDTENGLVVFNSCSHTGVNNTLIDISNTLNRNDIYAYVGGLHLYKFNDNELNIICNEIKNNKIKHIITGHCTEKHAYDFLRHELNNRIIQFSSGFTYTFC